MSAEHDDLREVTMALFMDPENNEKLQDHFGSREAMKGIKATFTVQGEDTHIAEGRLVSLQEAFEYEGPGPLWVGEQEADR